MSFGGGEAPIGNPATWKVPPEARLFTLVERHYRALAVAILCLAAFNLTYRLGLESVEEWDESLYATSAWEMLGSGNLIATTFGGELDYYNSKPPLNVWLIAAMFAAFGVNLVSMRLVSAVSAWLTVLVLQLWTRRVFGPTVSLLSSLVLSTTFGFIHLHSGRSGNPDALLTLLTLLTVVTLWAGERQPWRRIWLGPILAGVFLLKGMAVLMPLLLVLIVEAFARQVRASWKPLAVAVLLFLLPTGAWAVARWQVDGWLFFNRIVFQDFVSLASSAVERRSGSALYYFDVLQRYHYDWLVAGAGAAALAWRSWPVMARRMGSALRQRQPTMVLLSAWAVITLLVPTMMQTKLFWYLNPFYPLFAIIVALLLANVASTGSARRMVVAVVLITIAVASAEARSLWRIHVITNLDTSLQGLLLAQRTDFRGTRVCRDRPQRAEMFVVRAMLNTRFHIMTGANDAAPRSGDLYVFSREVDDPRLRPIGNADGNFLYEAP